MLRANNDYFLEQQLIFVVQKCCAFWRRELICTHYLNELLLQTTGGVEKIKVP
jgi:hypothetical protein